MNLFKRTFTSFYAKLDQMVGEIENHDALIKAAIDEQKGKIAQAKIQLRRIEQNEQRLKEQIAQLSINTRLWSQRAAREAEQNEIQALLCLQRRQQGQQQISRLEQMNGQYRSTAERMRRDIAQCEEELTAMVQKHQMLRARQSTADALQMIDRQQSASLEEVENSFDRWEVKIAQGELGVDRFDADIDLVEQEYLREENELELRQQLAELIKEQKMNEGDAS